MGAVVLRETLAITTAAATASGEQGDDNERESPVAQRLARGVDVEGEDRVCDTRDGRTLFELSPTMDREEVNFKTAPPLAS